MKQTSNAIKFLLAQYRSIFKNAYFKGLATAVVVTAGLAAGQAQAADQIYYDAASKDLSKDTITNPWAKATATDGSTVNPGSDIAGAIGSTTVSGGNLTIGGDSPIKSAGGSALGGVIIDTTGGHALNATSNNLYLKNGGSVTGSAYGAYLNTSGGNVTATDNHVHLDLSANDAFTISATTPSSAGSSVGGIFGVRIKTADGNARASGNSVEINADAASSLSLAHGGNGIVGALAEGTNNVAVTGNSVVINITDTTNTNNKLNLSSGGAYTLIGGHALNQTADKVASSLTSEGNIVSGSGFSIGGASGAFVFGGRAMNTADADDASTNVARNNQVDLSNVAISSTADIADGALQVVGNMAIASPDTAVANNNVTANGDGTKVSLKIANSTLSNIGTTLTSGQLNPNSLAAGGYAETNSGSATANQNVASITNTTATNVNFYGGVATVSAGDGDSAVQATGNSITIDNTDINSDSGTATSYTDSYVAGGVATLTGTITGAKVTASNNTVRITNTAYQADQNNAKSVDGSVFGGYITTSTSGATSVGNSNSVTIGNGVEVTGSVYGAYATHNGTFNDNQVSFDGSLEVAAADAPQNIVGVSIETGESGASVDKQAKLTITGNTVTIGADAKLANTNIVAVDLAAKNATQNSIIHSGNNVIVEGEVLFNKANEDFSLAGDDVQITNNAVVYVQNGNLNISGIANGADSAKYFNGTGTVAASAKIANNDTINVFNALKIEGDDSLIATKQGAALTVNGGNVQKEAENHTPVTDEAATLYISEAGLTGYLTATENKTYDLYSGTKVTDAAGAVDVTSGGTVDFGESVTLDNFDFTSGSNVAGKIQVDTGAITATNGSHFRAHTVNVEHALVTDNSRLNADLSNINKLKLAETEGIAIEANVLNLGSSGLSSSQSAAITFGQATARDEINFIAASSGQDTKTDGSVNTGINNDGYHLTSKVIGSNFMKTNDQTSTIDYYTALDGNVNGQVKIVSGGNLSLVDGHWTAHDQITVGASGTLSVGGTSKAEPLDNSASRPDATLATSGVVLDVSEVVAKGEATVQASGAGSLPEVEVGDNRNVVLDLTSGLTMKGIVSGPNETIKGKANIKASNNGVVILNASDVNTILGQNHKADPTSGAFFTADGKGVLQVEGDIVATFGDFDGNPDTNGFNLAADGILDATSLTVQNANVEPATGNSYSGDADYIASAPHIEFVGTVRVDDLVLNDEQLTLKSGGSTSYASQVTVGSGTMEVAKSISSVNGTVILGDADSSAHLVLNSDAVTDEGTVAIDLLRVDSGSITVENGEWTARDITLNQSGAELTVGDDTEALDVNGDETASSLTLNKLTMAAGSTFKVLADGTATVASADFSALDTTGRVNVAGVLRINGVTADGDATNGVKFGDEGSISIENNGSLQFGKLAVKGAILNDGTYTGSTITLRDGYSKIANNGGELYLEFASGTSFDSDAILAFKEALFTTGSFSDGVLKSGGILNIGAASFEGFNITERLEGEGLDGYTATWEQVKDFSDIYGNDVTNDVKNIANIRDIGLVDQVQGSWGSFSMESGVANGAQVNIAGNTWLNYAAGNNGFFISNADHSAALGAKVGSQKSLYLIGGGTIGRITLEQGDSDVERNLTTLQISDGDTTIDSINAINSNSTGTYATQVNVLSNTTVTNDITDVGEVNVLDGATLTAANADINDLFVEESITNITGTLTVNGTSYDGEALALGGQINAGSIVLEDGSDLTAIHDGTIRAKTVTVDNSSTSSLIQVGTDIDTITETISNKHENSYYTGTGYFEVSDYLDLNGATLLVDPAYDENTSVAAVMNFKHAQDKTYDTVFNDVGIINGSVLVGKNAALGIGATLDETRKAIASYQQGGALKADQYGSILYLNGQLTVDENSEVALNSDANVTTLEGVRDSLKYTITSQEVDQYADLGLGNNTAILMTEAAFEDADGNRTGTAISFNTKGATVNSLGGDIVLAGTFDASEKLNIFDDADKDGVKVVGTTGIEVRTQNGFLYYVIGLGDNKGKDIQLEVDKEHAYSIMSEASTPVVNSLIAYHEGRIDNTGNSGSNSGDQNPDDSVGMTPIVPNDDATQQTAQAKTTATEDLTPIEPPVENTANTAVRGASVFLNDVVNNSHGAPAEAVARMALYGGAVQAAIAANTSSYEAIAARTGVGATDMGLTVANNGMGAALWLAPMYKNQDSDSFDAEGLSYGVDMNLYGVALGADFEFMPGFTAGIMFNVGSGSADGQGNAAASSVSNDFDYYGISVYGNYKYDALSITADLGYTAVDSDIDAHTGLDSYSSVSTSVDSTAWTLGVTGKYTFNVGGVELAPHAGLRYSSIDLDDYSVSDIASYDADTMDIFSIPVGVTIAKEFQGESWSVKPSLDLSVQGNFGDDTSDGTVHWTGVDGLATNVSSEMMDNFTYGATLGVSAQTGSFSMGLGVNYTGSDNVDEFGVNANARFVF